MKNIDLRIGNYVQGISNTPEIIELVSKEEVDTNIHDALPLNQIEPIPLTEEWLLKLGLDKALNGFWDKSENWCIRDNDFFLGAKIYLSKVDYVHQLQNIFYCLTGEELTIKQTESI